ncbi:hypothetical protein [Pandoraea sp. ISTKB]|uniref:hypothetical protein n=1 Tax=Pandoraea sp. ISTKB TaxID=1586708 RepID=UPI00084649AE|nr:hypothetical protein [Pandoraea sp. ISTKB]ODP31077.1 hypothetical protein A9762_27460 [Pandoraea sp. ISTKB]
MENTGAINTAALQPISSPESSPPQPNAPIAKDLDKAKSAPMSTSISTYSSLSLPDWAYSKWAAMHESQDGHTYDELVAQLAREQNCQPNDVSVELLKNINCLEPSVRFGAFKAFSNSDPMDDRFFKFRNDDWLKNFEEKDRAAVRNALYRTPIQI